MLGCRRKRWLIYVQTLLYQPFTTETTETHQFAKLLGVFFSQELTYCHEILLTLFSRDASTSLLRI